MGNTTNPMNSLNNYLVTIITLIIMVSIVIGIVVSIVRTVKAVNVQVNIGHQKEGQLNASFVNCQNYYDAMIGEVQAIAKVTNEQAQRVTQSYLQYNQSKYEGAIPQFLMEQIPQLGQISSDQLYAAISKNTSAFKSAQESLIHQLGDFESWQKGTFTTRTFVHGFPTHELVARFGTNRLYGQSALEKMYDIVTFGETSETYTSGVRKPIL